MPKRFTEGCSTVGPMAMFVFCAWAVAKPRTNIAPATKLGRAREPVNRLCQLMRRLILFPERGRHKTSAHGCGKLISSLRTADCGQTLGPDETRTASRHRSE